MKIDRSFLSAALLAAAEVRFHASGHLALVRVRGDRRANGHLELDAEPGSGHLYFTAYAGGSGFAVDERYRDGTICSTLFSPWHDGVESSEPMEWTRWVTACLQSLEELVEVQRRRSHVPAAPQVR
jgi:hypothetical protein